MNTSGFCCETKFGLLIFLGHPNEDIYFRKCLSLFGWKGNILPKEHIVHCGFVKGKLSETFLSEKLPIVQGARLDICRERCRSRETTFTCTITKCVRKILESTDHTLVPMHYKQLAGEVRPVTCPQFQKEEVCRLATMSTSIQAQNTCFFYQCGKIASLFTSLQAWLKSNAAAKLQMKRKIPVLN